MPRENNTDGTISINLRRDGDSLTEVITDIKSSVTDNFVELGFSSTILEEDSTYYLEITKSGSLWYRDKVYSTFQQYEKDFIWSGYDATFSEAMASFGGDLDEKHKIGNGKLYKTYDSVDDNTYII